jgi:hypothetical protein
MIRDVNGCPSEPEIYRPTLGSQGAGDGVLVPALVYGGWEAGKETSEEGGWEVAECGARVREDGLGEGRGCDGD